MEDRLPRTAAEMQLLKTVSAPQVLDAFQQKYAEMLMACHGNVKVARESSGLHFYIACPNCLQTEGESELSKMHLALNVQRYMHGNTGAALCMKCRAKYMMDELAMWPPLEARGYPTGPPRIVDQPLVTEETHEQDEHGRWVPKGPGDVVPVTDLPADHPCALYLASRAYDPQALNAQMGACYCEAERPDVDNRRYKRMLNGFRATPQGRLILFVYQHGVRVGWQARILECEDEHHKYYFHPYKKDWLPVLVRETPEGEWNEMEGWEGWEPVKYATAKGSKRNQCLLGYDSARLWNTGMRLKKRWTFLCEGPLDAARLGMPAVAVCGKSCSRDQAALLAAEFQAVVVVPDRDAAGAGLSGYVQQWTANSNLKVYTEAPPERFKDAGEMSPVDALMFRQIVRRKLEL